MAGGNKNDRIDEGNCTHRCLPCSMHILHLLSNELKNSASSFCPHLICRVQHGFVPSFAKFLMHTLSLTIAHMKTIRKGKIRANNNILSLNIFNCEGGIITAVTLQLGIYSKKWMDKSATRYYSFRTNVIQICTLLSYSLKVFKNKTTEEIIYNNNSWNFVGDITEM